MSLNDKQEHLDSVCEIENTSEILSFTVPRLGVPVWPAIRTYVIKECSKVLTPSLSAFTKHDPFPKSTFTSNYKNFELAIKKWPQKDIWLHSFLFYTYYKQHNGRFYDYLYEPFAEVFPQNTLFMDSCVCPPFISPTAGFSMLRMEPTNVWLRKMARDVPDSLYLQFSTQFMLFLKERIEKYAVIFPEQFYTNLFFCILEFCKLAMVRTKFYDIILQRACPKVFMAHALLDGNCPDVVYFLRKNGVTVVEAQHSIIDKNLFYTNFAPKILEDQNFKEVWPNYFLSFGSFWHDKMSIPSETYIVGNPWFSMCLDKYSYTGEDAILFALNFDYDSFLPYVRAIQKQFPQKKIIIRPHPAHREIFYKRTQMATLSNVEHDISSNIFETLSRCDTVISEFSGAVYDAVSLGKRVFVIRQALTKSIESKGVMLFDSTEELIELLQTVGLPSKNVSSLYFETNWVANYKKFVHTKCQIEK